jgi:superfamily II DNA or RNA helicase
MENLLKQGTDYEIYIRDIIKNKYKNCWLWKDIPNEILLELGFINEININCDDIGCDILAKNHNNTYEYIQCKNYSTLGIDNTITISDLSGFYNFVAENDIKTAIVYYSGVLSSQIQCRKKKIKYINLPFVKINNEDIKPRDYQIEAYNTLKDVIKDTNRGILEMPCGTGKTLVSYLISLDYNNIILLSPLISTTEQLLKHYKNYYSKEKEPINFSLVSSQHNRNIDNIEISNKNIIGSTYDSCDIINKVIPKLTGSIFIVIDECHNISNNMITDSNNEVNKILFSNYKILYVSATPKNYNKEYNNIFGSSRYTLTWNTAISNKYICDYNFYYPNANKIIEYIDEIKFDKTIIEKTKLIYKSFFLLESIKTLDLKKCIVYLKTVKESEQFENILKLINIYHGLKIAVYNINYNSSKTTRNISLTKFRSNNTKICIMLNVHVLDEGIDIPECDSVFLTNPNNNPINIIQRISRANRITKNNEKIANILIWSKNNSKMNNLFKNLSNYININIATVNNEFINNTSKIANNIIENDSQVIKSNISILNILEKLDNFKYIDDKTIQINNKNIIIIKDNYNKIWFSISDFFKILGYSSPNKEIKRIDINIENIKTYQEIYNSLFKKYINFEKHKNLQPHMKMTNETGIFLILTKSKKNIAKKIIDSLYKIIL